MANIHENALLRFNFQVRKAGEDAGILQGDTLDLSNGVKKVKFLEYLCGITGRRAFGIPANITSCSVNDFIRMVTNIKLKRSS